MDKSSQDLDSDEDEEGTNHFQKLFAKWSITRGPQQEIKPEADRRISDLTNLDVKEESKCTLIGNFIKLNVNAEKRVSEYLVTFEPRVMHRSARHKIILQFKELGERPTFDGDSALYLPIKLTERITILNGHNPFEEYLAVKVTIKFRQTVRIDELKPFCTALFFQFLDILGLRQINDKFYDMQKKHRLPKHKLSLRPGYTTFVRYTDNGLMIGMNLAHLVQREVTFYDFLDQIRDLSDFKERFSDFAIGKVAVTPYNNICYAIDDIDWDMTPNSKFKSGSREITYADYYRLQYGIKVQDKTQPMLLSRARRREQAPVFEVTPGTTKLLPLIPELCFPSGLTEEFRKKKEILVDLGEYTIHKPSHRIKTLRDLMTSVKSNPDCVDILQLWGLEIGDDFVEMDGRIISGPTIKFNENLTLPNVPAEFASTALRNPCYNPVPLKRWQVYCVSRDVAMVEIMIENYERVASRLGIYVSSEGEIISIKIPPGRGPRPEDFRASIEENVVVGEIQFIIVVLPTGSDAIYSAIKCLCLKELGIPSQVILAHKIRGERRVREIMERVVPQINCKLGGSLWALKIPTEEDIMFVGMDTFHDPRKFRRSVHGMVATLNSESTLYYSRATVQAFYQEICYTLKTTFARALKTYREKNNKLPGRIVVFRDGVSSDQFENVMEYEVTAMKEAVKSLYSIFPKFCFVIVQKRIWERAYAYENKIVDNPRMGTVLDNTMTKPNMTDFYLVSQTMSHGTVRPTHCVILDDCGENNPELIQKFTHISAFMYYNWPGSIRIPAVCQYAHKIASVVGNHLKEEPKIGMEDKLYYL